MDTFKNYLATRLLLIADWLLDTPHNANGVEHYQCPRTKGREERAAYDAERRGLHSHAERGNEGPMRRAGRNGFGFVPDYGVLGGTAPPAPKRPLSREDAEAISDSLMATHLSNATRLQALRDLTDYFREQGQASLDFAQQNGFIPSPLGEKPAYRGFNPGIEPLHPPGASHSKAKADAPPQTDGQSLSEADWQRIRELYLGVVSPPNDQ